MKVAATFARVRPGETRVPQSQRSGARAAQPVRPAVILPELDKAVREVEVRFHVVPVAGNHV